MLSQVPDIHCLDSIPVTSSKKECVFPLQSKIFNVVCDKKETIMEHIVAIWKKTKIDGLYIGMLRSKILSASKKVKCVLENFLRKLFYRPVFYRIIDYGILGQTENISLRSKRSHD